MEAAFKEKIFITGISGFTGKHLETYLKARNFDVYGSVLGEPAFENHFSCDILSENSLFKILDQIKPDYIVHLAAISFVAAQNQQNMYNVNIFGTLSLLNATEKLHYIPKKILIASSAAVYGNIEGELHERMCPEPINHYGNSKLVMENMTKAYFNNQNIIITRPFNYTGVGQERHFLIPKIVTHYKERKEEIQLGNIDVFREFNDVNFVIKCYSELLFSKTKSEIVNVCTGNELSINNILDAASKITGHKIKVNVNPEFIRKNELKILKGSPNRMCSIIGDFTQKYKIEGTLKEMLK
jgi:nucleoside-diphosphate-sugar epimerase